MDVGSRVVAAAIRILERASTAEALSLLTVEALRNEMRLDGNGPPPSSQRVARTFGSDSANPEFDRSALVVAILECATGEILDRAQRQADAYLQAADTARRGGGPEVMIAAVARHMREHEPAGVVSSVNARERALYLGVALSDDDPRIARVLREFLQVNEEIYENALMEGLTLLRRRLASGVSAQMLIRAGHAYMRGTQLYVRSGTPVTDDTVAGSLLRIIWSHTAPREGPEPDVVAELWSGIEHRQDA